MNANTSTAKRGVDALLEKFLIKRGWSLDTQSWILEHLPLDYWRRSVAYQQCIANRVIERFGAVVQAGPFVGMKYISDAIDGCLVPKLIGCYEEELWYVVEGFVKAGFQRVVDVGCASGYYAAGLAMRMPEAEVYAYDTESGARGRCAQVIALNKLEKQVRLRELCTTAELESLVQGRTLLIIDCEGAEMELLDPALVPSLSRCDMLVEVHDFIKPNITETLRERFKGTHSIETISSKTRNPDVTVYPGLAALTEKHWPAALDERRPVVMDWLILRSNENGSPTAQREVAVQSHDEQKGSFVEA